MRTSSGQKRGWGVKALDYWCILHPKLLFFLYLRDIYKKKKNSKLGFKVVIKILQNEKEKYFFIRQRHEKSCPQNSLTFATIWFGSKTIICETKKQGERKTENTQLKLHKQQLLSCNKVCAVKCFQIDGIIVIFIDFALLFCFVFKIKFWSLGYC